MNLLDATAAGNITAVQDLTLAALAPVIPDGLLAVAKAHALPDGQVYLAIAVHDAVQADSSRPYVARSARTLDAPGRRIIDPWWEVDPERQGQGLASALTPALEAAHAAAGFTRIDIRAQGPGGYTWARLGYTFRTPLARLDFLRRARAWARTQPVDYGDVLAPGSEVTPGQLADTEHGRTLLIAVPWDGTKILG